jgi:predicted nucleic acid-binding Zn ribbon protein
MSKRVTKAQAGRSPLWQPDRISYDEYLRVHRNADHPDHGRLIGLAFRAKPLLVGEGDQTAVALPGRAMGHLYAPMEERVRGRAVYEAFADLQQDATRVASLDQAAVDACIHLTDFSIETAAKFVSRYGLLVQNEPVMPSGPWIRCCRYGEAYSQPPTDEQGPVNGIRWILLESLMMRRGVALARAFKEVERSGSPAAVQALWSPTKEGRRLFEFGTDDWLSNGRWDQEVRWANAYLRDLVQGHVQLARVGFTVRPSRMRTLPGKISGYRYEETFNYGKGLLGNLWVQFARAELTNLSNSRLCLTCGKAFEPARSNQVYCSKVCGSRLRVERSRRRRIEVPEDIPARIVRDLSKETLGD